MVPFTQSVLNADIWQHAVILLKQIQIQSTCSDPDGLTWNCSHFNMNFNTVSVVSGGRTAVFQTHKKAWPLRAVTYGWLSLIGSSWGYLRVSFRVRDSYLMACSLRSSCSQYSISILSHFIFSVYGRPCKCFYYRFFYWHIQHISNGYIGVKKN